MARSGLTTTLLSGLVFSLILSGNMVFSRHAVQQRVFEDFSGSGSFQATVSDVDNAFYLLRHAFNDVIDPNDPCERKVDRLIVYVDHEVRRYRRRRGRRNLRRGNNSTDDDNIDDLVLIEVSRIFSNWTHNTTSVVTSRSESEDSHARNLKSSTIVTILSATADVFGRSNSLNARLVPTASGRRNLNGQRKLWAYDNYLPSNWKLRNTQSDYVRDSTNTRLEKVLSLLDP